MSVSRAVFIHCDICEESEQGDNGTSTVGDARADCKRLGWHRTRDGQDICAGCWDDRKEVE